MADEDLFDAAGLYTILRETHLGALSAIYQMGFLLISTTWALGFLPCAGTAELLPRMVI